MQRYLQKEGYAVLTASSGPEGLELARRRLPGAITLDVMMAGMDGWTVLKLLKDDPSTQNIPVVMYSAEASVQGSVVAERLGAQGFVSKGSTPWADFLAKIKKLTDPLAG